MQRKPEPIWRAVLLSGCIVEGYDFKKKVYRPNKPKKPPESVL